MRVQDVREEFVRLYKDERFVVDKTGVKMVEIIGQSFLADEDSIFGEVNWDYAKRELDWYVSMSLNVNDIPGGPPKIWKQVATPDGRINSNYGWMIFSKDNGSQYDNVLKELEERPDSRRAEMIYTRPSMHYDYDRDGMSDFVCTDAVSFFIRDERLHCHVKMRSNDSVFGYRNDRVWHDWVLTKLSEDLGVVPGDIYWTASSLHVYERHFKLIDDYIDG